MPKPDHKPRTWCPSCGSVCVAIPDEGFTTFHAIKEPTIGTYTESEIVAVFAERKRFRDALERIKCVSSRMGWYTEVDVITREALKIEEPS